MKGFTDLSDILFQSFNYFEEVKRTFSGDNC